MLPYLQYIKNPSKQYSAVFRGLNYGEGTQDGEFAETHNLSTDLFPCITQRAARIKAGEYKAPSTIHAKGSLLVIDGTDVYYGDKKVGEVTEGKKQTATIGNYVVIFPDKKYYKVPTDETEEETEEDTTVEGQAEETTEESAEDLEAKEGKFGNMEEEYRGIELSFTASTITRKYAELPFREEDTITISGCEVTDNNKAVVIKSISGNELTFEENTFTEAEEEGIVTLTRDEFVIPQTQYDVRDDRIIQIGANDAPFPFKAGDVVNVNGKEHTLKDATDTTLYFERYTFEVSIFGDTKSLIIKRDGAEMKYSGLSFKPSSITINYADFAFREGDAVTITGCENNDNNKTTEIIIRGVEGNVLTFDDDTFTKAEENGIVTIKRSVPDLDFICESNYRLWGTHGNTIYSSKFSDPFNFKVFDGLSNDSYAIDVGSEGKFTGCIPYSSHICFFKENTLHKLYGTKPSNFQITTSNVYGVQSGSERSMQVVNEQLLYKGVGGVYAYTGGVPELISGNFGNKMYSEAVACCDGEKYYISMKRGDTWDMFAYDVMKNIWLREDDTQAVDMTFYDGKVYFLDAEGGLYYIDKTADRSDIEWGATFCTMHETVNERKGYSKFHLRMDMDAGAWIAVDIKTDNDLQWKQVYTTHNEKAKTVSIPIMPTRCDSIDIRLRGKGKCTIKAFIREFTVGSDV